MILYFSGTGNSRFVAERIADALGDSLISVNDKIRNSDFSPLSDDSRFVFVCPTYAWRIPAVCEDYIINTDFNGTDKIWFVMTCGGETGDSEKYLKKLCAEKNLTFMGLAPIVMPDNYIIMFSAVDKKTADRIVEKAEPAIDNAINRLSENKKFVQTRSNLYDKAMSSIVNPMFYSMYVHDNKFTAGDNCIGCGVCEKKCPLGNIEIKGGKPVWNGNCTHCMACISYCPETAIEFGKKTKGKARYFYSGKHD